MEGKIIEQIGKPILEKKPRKKYVKKVKPQTTIIVEPSMEPVVEPSVVPPVGPTTEPTTEPSAEQSMEETIRAAPISRPATPRHGRPRKYYTEEEAKDMARLQRKQFKQRLREKQKVFKSGISELQLSAQKFLNKVVLSKEDLIKIIDIIEGNIEQVDVAVQTF
ncbi:MAG: hypothetical protein EZS28_008669 [Streblomastix strix]|uniref:Uncharacterized protein n=1 Tax=Streblomastix strix TaxID=222440 RepID=A0A5J4WL72_9EUKA|nr:MAG: hypothetical protein EZS28_008669 [Streblomastix strix]